MKHVRAFVCLIGSGMIALGGCTRGSGANASKQAEQGTGDSGGGNTYKGRPLDSYLVAPKTLPAFRRIAPILEKLSQREITLNRRLNYMFETKFWYFIPDELSQLPAATIGSVVATEQVALQNFTQVWVSEPLFSKMTEEDQARLLLHEAVMGLRLFKFDSNKHKCMASVGRVDFCSNETEIFRGSPSDLTPQDYDAVRSAVGEIERHYTTLDYQGWQNLMYRLGFEDFEGSETQKDADYADVYAWLLSAKTSGRWPSYGYDGAHLLSQNPELANNPRPSGRTYIWRPHDTCSIELLGNPQVWQLRFVSSARSVLISAPQAGDRAKMPLRLRPHPYAQVGSRKLFWSGDISMGKSTDHIGDRSYDVTLMFDSDDLAEFRIHEMICVGEQDGYCTGWRNPADGFEYYCSVEKSFYLTY